LRKIAYHQVPSADSSESSPLKYNQWWSFYFGVSSISRRRKPGSSLIEEKLIGEEPLLSKKSESWKVFISGMFKAGSKDTRPSSLPKNFPNHTDGDLRERPSRIIAIGEEQGNVLLDTAVLYALNFHFKRSVYICKQLR